MIKKRLPTFRITLAGIAALALILGTAHAAETGKSADAAKAAGTAKADTAKVDENKPVVMVNGTVITVNDLKYFAQEVSSNRGQKMSMEQILNTLVDRELLYQEALAKGYEKRGDVIRELDNQRRSLLANVAVSEALRANPVTDQELHKLYKDKVLATKVNEYKARHILLKTEGEAKDIIAQLDKGADFSALAKSKSIDPGSAEKGGDVGWFSPGQMVPEFSKATEALKKGKYTETPVKSQFGWHVILLDDIRPVAPPKFDDIKNRLEGVAQSEHLNEYLNELRKKAVIQPK